MRVVEVASLANDFLENLFDESLPIGNGEVLIYDGPEAKIYARLIDQAAVQRHLKSFLVKTCSPMLNKLLGEFGMAWWGDQDRTQNPTYT